MNPSDKHDIAPEQVAERPKEAQQSMSPSEVRVQPSEPPSTARQESVTAYFESRAAYWDDIYHQRDLHSVIYQKRFDAVMQMVDQFSLPLGSHILDLGCGAGVYSVALAKRGFVVEAVDVSPAMLERTRRHAAEAQVGDRVRATMGNVFHLPFHDEAFSLVLAIGTLAWLDPLQKAVEELARVIKPGGYLLLTVENSRRLDHLLDPLKSPAFSLARQMVKSVFRVSYWQSHPGPVAVWAYRHSVQDWDELLAGTELRRVQTKTLGFGPFTFFDHQFLPDWFGVKVHRLLQYLASLGFPGLRSTGRILTVLAKKRG